MLDPNLSVKTAVIGLASLTDEQWPSSATMISSSSRKLHRQSSARHKWRSAKHGARFLAVNSASERGMLGVALHPNFLLNGLCSIFTGPKAALESISTNLADVALLGNRVDRYIWNGSTLAFDRNFDPSACLSRRRLTSRCGEITIGGILRFGPDGKLYILMGDNCRRGLLQNNQPVPGARRPVWRTRAR